MAQLRRTSRRSVLIGALVCGALHCGPIAPQGAAAHPGDEARGLLIGVMGAEKMREADGKFDVEVGLLFMNQTTVSATLRGVTAEIGERVRVLETVSVFGFETERPVSFFKLDPGETRMIQPPGGRIVVEGVRADELEFRSFMLTLDFGPTGQPEVMVLLDGAEPPAVSAPAAPASEAPAISETESAMPTGETSVSD